MVDSSLPLQDSTFALRRRTPGTFLLVPSPKQGRSIRCQGQLEAATAQILVACPLVDNIQEQPLRIWYAWKEESGEIVLLESSPTKELRKAHRTSYIVPDFLVTMTDGAQRLIEVKPSRKLDRPLVRRKLSVARLFAERHGWTFHVITERQLFSGPLLSNIRLLSRFRLLHVNPLGLAPLLAAAEAGPITLGSLHRQVAATGDAVLLSTHVWHLTANGRLDLDPLAGPFTNDTLLYPGGTHPWDPFGSVWEPSGCSTNGCFASSGSSAPINSSPKI